MSRIGLAFKAFFAVLFNAAAATHVSQALAAPDAAAHDTPPAPPRTPLPVAEEPKRSDALTLLGTLQREARFIDFIKEPLAGFSDAQIGAVARDVHRDCGAVLERMLEIKPVLETEEGSAVEVPVGFDASVYRLTGNVTGEPPFRGELAHHGWRAVHCNVPQWTGSAEATLVIAPVEVELK